MPAHDRTGEPLTRKTAAEHRAEIRYLLCPGPDTCPWDHDHRPASDQPTTETIDPEE